MLNTVYIIVLILFVLMNAFEIYLEGLNAHYLKRRSSRIPEAFGDKLDETVFQKMQGYEFDKKRFSMIMTAFQALIIGAFLFTGLFDLYHSAVVKWELPFAVKGWIMITLPLLAFQFLSIPFDLYHQFVLEKKHGFSTVTPKLWFGDFLKSLLISVILSVAILIPGFALVNRFPQGWWIGFYLFYMAFNLLMMYLAPYVLLPLFNKFTPLENEALAEKITALMERAGISVKQVFQMDASKRSKHSNAFFIGTGDSKRIVLYDTLLQSMTEDQILAVLAHEAGHWKKKHIFKRLVTNAVLSAGLFYISYLLLNGNWIAQAFPVTTDSFFIRLIYLALIYSVVSPLLSPIGNLISRRHEREADRFSVELTGNGNALADALINLGVQNLSNPYPHPLYVVYHYSHPPLLERIKSLRER